jgi:hypothetical protein
MNLFITDPTPELAARHLDDKRLGSALMEANLMLSLGIKKHDPNFDAKVHVGPGKVCAGMAHENHPVSKWVRATMANFVWTSWYAAAVAAEWTFRFGNEHGSAPRTRYIWPMSSCIPAGELTPFQNSAKNNDLGVDYTFLEVPYSYQEYLKHRWRGDKRSVTFTKRGAPSWAKEFA